MKPIGIINIFVLILLSFLSIFGEYSSSAAKGKSVLVITLDTTRADHLGCYNGKNSFTPNIDSLGNRGVIFENCFSTVPLTLPSHSSIFTGRYPVTINVRNNGRYFLSEDKKTLAELFKEKGFYTFAVISSYVLMSKFGLSQGFDFYDDSLDATEKVSDFNSEISAKKVFNKFKLIMEKVKGRRFFGWVHFYDPHIPYSPPGKYALKFKKDPYLGEIAYMDEYVGKIVKELKKRNLFENTLIVIAGDHGEDKGEHRELGHGIFCYNVSLKVPLIFVNADIFSVPKRIKKRVTLIDIFPTLSSIFGLNDVKNIQGKNLIPLYNDPHGCVDRTVFFESLHGKEEMGWAPLTGVIDGNYKYISLPEPELYDIKKDSSERKNLFQSKKNIALKLDKELAGFYSRNFSKNSTGKRELSERDIQHLATLGYISSFKKSGRSIDPKEGIKYIDKLREVKVLINGEKVNEAEKLLKRLFFSRNRIKTIHAYKLFDLIYRKKGDLKSLIKFRELALKDFPKNENIKILLASSYFNSYRFNDSEKLCKDIIKDNPKNTQALVQLGKIYLNEKRFELSVRSFLKASSIEPNNIGIKKDLIVLYLKMKEREKALKLLNSIAKDNFLVKNPDNVKLLLEISRLFVRAGNMKKGERLLLEMEKYSGKNPIIMTSLGEFYYRIRKPDKSYAYFKKAMDTDPEFSPAYNGMGVLLLTLSRGGKERDKLERSFQMFEKAIKLNPKYAEALNGRGTANIFLGNLKNAVRDLEKALKLNPTLIDVYFNLGIIHLKTGNRKRANKLFKLCKERFYRNLNPGQKKRLDRLITESNY